MTKYILRRLEDVVYSTSWMRHLLYLPQVVAQETQTSQRFKTSTFVTINVTDVNDNNPTCGKSVYKVTIAENNANGTFVTKVRFQKEVKIILIKNPLRKELKELDLSREPMFTVLSQ